MTISVTCESCGKTLRAKDSAAGKQAKCPDCGEPIVIPLPQKVDEEADHYGFDDGGFDDGGFDDGGFDDGGFEDAGYGAEPKDDGWDSGGSGGTRSCPACAETIKSVAVKCRFCGEVFDSTILRRQKKTSSKGRALATPGSRLAAALLDGLIQIPIVIAFVVGIMMTDGNQEGVGIAILVLCGILFLALAIYQLVIISRDGQSIGKRIMKIRIVKYEDNSNPGFVHAVLLRAFVNGLIGGIPLVGPIYSLADLLFIFGEEHRCLHDLIASTKVVEAG